MSRHPDIRLLPREYKDEVADVSAESLGLAVVIGTDNLWDEIESAFDPL